MEDIISSRINTFKFIVDNFYLCIEFLKVLYSRNIFKARSTSDVYEKIDLVETNEKILSMINENTKYIEITNSKIKKLERKQFFMLQDKKKRKCLNYTDEDKIQFGGGTQKKNVAPPLPLKEKKEKKKNNSSATRTRKIGIYRDRDTKMLDLYY